MSDRVNVLFNELEQKYDYIIVDTAPVGIVTDTLLISRFADTVITGSSTSITKKNVKCSSRLTK